MGGMAGGRASNLDKLFEAWGVSVTSDQFVGDDRYALTVSGLDAQPVRHLGIVGIDPDGFDKDDVVTSGLNLVNLGFRRAYHVARQGARAQLTPLIQSSDLAALVITTDNSAFTSDPALLRDGLQPDRQALHPRGADLRQGAEHVPQRATRRRAPGRQPISAAAADPDQRGPRGRRRSAERTGSGCRPRISSASA